MRSKFENLGWVSVVAVSIFTGQVAYAENDPPKNDNQEQESPSLQEQKKQKRKEFREERKKLNQQYAGKELDAKYWEELKKLRDGKKAALGETALNAQVNAIKDPAILDANMADIDSQIASLRHRLELGGNQLRSLNEETNKTRAAELAALEGEFKKGGMAPNKRDKKIQEINEKADKEIKGRENLLSGTEKSVAEQVASLEKLKARYAARKVVLAGGTPDVPGKGGKDEPPVPPATNAGQECLNAVKDYFGDKANNAAVQKFLKIQGEITLNRLSWAYLSQAEKDGGKSKNLEESILRLLKDKYNPKPGDDSDVGTGKPFSTAEDKKAFMEARTQFEKNKLSRRALTDIMPRVANVLEAQAAASPELRPYLVAESDIKMLDLLDEKETKDANGRYNSRFGSDPQYSLLNMTKLIDSAAQGKDLSQGSVAAGKAKVQARLKSLNTQMAQVSGEISKSIKACQSEDARKSLCTPDGKTQSFETLLTSCNEVLSKVYEGVALHREDAQDVLKYGTMWAKLGLKSAEVAAVPPPPGATDPAATGPGPARVGTNNNVVAPSEVRPGAGPATAPREGRQNVSASDEVPAEGTVGRTVANETAVVDVDKHRKTRDAFYKPFSGKHEKDGKIEGTLGYCKVTRYYDSMDRIYYNVKRGADFVHQGVADKDIEDPAQLPKLEGIIRDCIQPLNPNERFKSWKTDFNQAFSNKKEKDGKIVVKFRNCEVTRYWDNQDQAYYTVKRGEEYLSVGVSDKNLMDPAQSSTLEGVMLGCAKKPVYVYGGSKEQLALRFKGVAALTEAKAAGQSITEFADCWIAITGTSNPNKYLVKIQNTKTGKWLPNAEVEKSKFGSGLSNFDEIHKHCSSTWVNPDYIR